MNPYLEIDKQSRMVQFRQFALELVDAKQGYEWGKETPIGADCSGTISYPLIRMGYKVRVTAQEYFSSMFDQTSMPFYDDKDIDTPYAAFYFPLEQRKSMGGMTKEDYDIVHVAPMIENGVLIDADFRRDRVLIKYALDLEDELHNFGFGCVYGKLNWDIVEQKSGKAFYGVDDLLKDNTDLEGGKCNG